MGNVFGPHCLPGSFGRGVAFGLVASILAAITVLTAIACLMSLLCLLVAGLLRLLFPLRSKAYT